jgi:alkylresorcinol/alkylpyrone synthase
MRFINDVFTASVGTAWSNERLLPVYEQAVERLELTDDARVKLRDFVRFQLVGKRSRRTVVSDWTALGAFAGRAEAFERGAEEALDALAAPVAAAVGLANVTFDAVVTTTTTGNLMPGLSFRMARRLPGLVRPDSLMLDLANAGCTGSTRALKLACSLEPAFRNVLLIALELPTTLVDTTGAAFDLWQGNCTFGDGAAALWISTEPRPDAPALAVEEIRTQQFAAEGLRLIRWAYRDYYTFALSDYQAFDGEVRRFVTEALAQTQARWNDEPRWAIHPAGLALLMRLSRRLGIPHEAIEPSVAHYREHSNMSSVSVLYLLDELRRQTPVGSAFNVLTMGAGFEVIYARARRVEGEGPWTATTSSA